MVFGYPSWFELNHLPNPPAVVEMVEAVKRSEHHGVELRKSEDIEALLRSRAYALARGLLKNNVHAIFWVFVLPKEIGTVTKWMLKVSI